MEEGCQLPQDAAPVLLAHDVKHILSHRRLLCDSYLWQTDSQPALSSDYRWVKEEALDDYAKPRLVEIMLDMVKDYL